MRWGNCSIKSKGSTMVQPIVDRSDREHIVAYLREVARRWRERTPFNSQVELLADEFDEAAAAIEAGEHLREAGR